MTFSADTNIFEFFRPIPILITDTLTYRLRKFCHYFSINLTLEASLIPLQRKTIANKSRSPVLFTKKQTKNTTILHIHMLEQL